MTAIVARRPRPQRSSPARDACRPADYSGVAMAATAALLRHGTGRLHLVCVPASGMQSDILVGEGLVATLETSAVTLGEAGGAPRFQAAARKGSVSAVDATCPAIHAGLLAAQKGVPFMPIRGIIGSDVLAQRKDWKVIDNPFASVIRSSSCRRCPRISRSFMRRKPIGRQCAHRPASRTRDDGLCREEHARDGRADQRDIAL